ncbi:hypothetical protein ACRE_090300 [Hapsidospora chrysogenum ATCC 11550]|uniref:Uncharacterized protein n=1 Tax=Hapsidospora chrysogenum (strain ATCC 11550 / CBS 779.69 / DSM 880 / IAM 14645 / JCM 23072 / IMI 49137) TaxID=857340 RepID=A0A086ST76_HAPC1|nr:hypothetical protein ACRE_090300 [Hapsidospora chrysogenum ATCC 11550]
MSGTGGFYKYRCKYFYSHNCPNWVWVNNSACATCLAEGREDAQLQQYRRRQQHQQAQLGHPDCATTSRDLLAPRVQDGVLQYRMMELAAPTEAGGTSSSSSSRFWTLRDKEPSTSCSFPSSSFSSNYYYVTSAASASDSRPPPALPVTSAMPSVTVAAGTSTSVDGLPGNSNPPTAADRRFMLEPMGAPF